MSQQHRPRYDGNAEWYDELFARYGDLADPLSSSSLLARLLGPGGGRCLDVACGGGLHHDAIASTGRTIIGVDLSSDQLQVARRRGRAALVRGSAAALPFTDESFPIVVCTYLHTDIDDMTPVFVEVNRVLRPGGKLVYLGVHPCFWGHFIENRGAVAASFTRDTWKRDGSIVLTGAILAGSGTGSAHGTPPSVSW